MYHKTKYYSISIIAVGLFAASVFLFSSFDVSAVTIDELSDKIDAKRSRVDELQKQMEKYKADIKLKKGQASSLNTQISILEDQVGQTEVDIEKTGNEVESTILEIDKTTQEIELREREIDEMKGRLAELVRFLFELSEQSGLEIILGYDDFSDYLDQVEYIENVQDESRKVVIQIQELRDLLEEKRTEQEDKKLELENLQEKLESQKRGLEDVKSAKGIVLNDTLSKQANYEQLLEAARKEYLRANSAIKSLESQIRAQLEALGYSADKLPKVGRFRWPVAPNDGISAFFLDPDYEKIFGVPHYAIDIPTYQGTPIKAPAPGYLGKNQDSGMGYSYIILLHGGDLSTVYGHISNFAISEGTFVTTGQVIGYTGGTPGTPGAGYLTTGPHLHFEVRVNGDPVNPLGYLDSY